MTSPERANYFTFKELAMGHATAAELMANCGPSFLNQNEALKPLIGHHLFQSLEMSLKHAFITSGLITIAESRDKRVRNGHGITELAEFAYRKLGANDFTPIIMALTHTSTHPVTKEVLQRMIYDELFHRTRESYVKRNLTYGQIGPDDYNIITPIMTWIDCVKDVASGVDYAARIIKHWSLSKSSSQSYAIIDDEA